MCPAVIFAASRNDRVKGRTSTLVVSIRTKNGFNQSGAPSGRKWAVLDLGFFTNLEIIRLSHKGSPRDRVNRRWLDKLKQYGINPIKLTEIISKNSKAIGWDMPFKEFASVRCNWLNIISTIRKVTEKTRLLAGNIDKIKIRVTAGVKDRKISFIGIKDLDMWGSNIEKISGSMQNSDFYLFRTLKVLSLS